MAFHRALGHGNQLDGNAHLHGVGKQRVAHNDAVYDGQGQVARVDGKTFALSKVHARLATAQRCLIGNIVVNKSGRMEVLDSGSGGKCATDIATYRSTCSNADKRTMTLATVLAVLHKRSVQVLVHIGVATRRNERIDDVADFVRIAAQVRFEQRGRSGLGRCIFCLAVCLEILDVLDDLGILHVRCDVCHLQRFRYNRAPAKTGHC